MKRTINILILLFAISAGVMAQSAGGRVSIDNPKVELSGENVTLSMKVRVDGDALKNNERLIFAPVVTNGEHKVSYSPVVVQGKKMETVWVRHQKAAGVEVDFESAQYARNGSEFMYTATVPFQYWMGDASLVLESVLEGCCSANRLSNDMLISKFYTIQEPEPQPEPEPVVTDEFIPVTVGDTLSLSFSFIIPEKEYDPNEPIYDEDRENSIIVYYPLNKSGLIPDFEENKTALNNLMAAINAIQRSEDSYVKHVIVAGFASPEGAFNLNDRLAWERAVAVREYIRANSSVDENFIKMHNGSEDWQGLRMLIEKSEMAEKDQLLEIIEKTPILSSDQRTKLRLEKIKQLNNGETYKYLYENFFPKLRNGAFIRVYYANKE